MTKIQSFFKIFLENRKYFLDIFVGKQRKILEYLFLFRCLLPGFYTCTFEIRALIFCHK